MKNCYVAITNTQMVVVFPNGIMPTDAGRADFSVIGISNDLIQINVRLSSNGKYFGSAGTGSEEGTHTRFVAQPDLVSGWNGTLRFGKTQFDCYLQSDGSFLLSCKTHNLIPVKLTNRRSRKEIMSEASQSAANNDETFCKRLERHKTELNNLRAMSPGTVTFSTDDSGNLCIGITKFI